MRKRTGYVDNLTQYRIDFDADEVFKEMVYPSLTKEDFWNKLMVTCPKAVTSFCNWIDEYKQIVNFDKLMGNKTTVNAAVGIKLAAKRDVPTKFHDLPFPMQYGILCQYFNDLVTGGYMCNSFKCPKYSLNLSETVDEIIKLFMEHQDICSLPAGRIWPK